CRHVQRSLLRLPFAGFRLLLEPSSAFEIFAFVGTVFIVLPDGLQEFRDAGLRILGAGDALSVRDILETFLLLPINEFRFEFADTGLGILGAARQSDHLSNANHNGTLLDDDFRFEFADLHAPLLDRVGLFFFKLADALHGLLEDYGIALHASGFLLMHLADDLPDVHVPGAAAVPLDRDDQAGRQLLDEGGDSHSDAS